MTDPIRLSKRLAEQLGCSRREAELYIEGGWVSVDGQVVEAPYFKVQAQRVELLPGATLVEIPSATLLLHKPAGLATAADAGSALQTLQVASRWTDDPSAIPMLQRHFSRLVPLLPLPADAGGLVVFSQERSVIRKLEESGNKLEQEYVVEVAGEAVDNGLEKLAQGITHRGVSLPRVKASWQNESHLRLALKAPRPGELGQLCEAIGLQLISCRRIRIGRLSMAKLPVGQWRYLGEHERF